MLGDRELAGDVVQDAFAKALRGRKRFRRQGSLESWLWSAVVNTARNAGRSRSLRMRVTPLIEGSPIDPPHGAMADGAMADGAMPDGALAGGVAPDGIDPVAAEERSRVRELVAQLPERQRMCVFLHYFADLDYATIAAALDIRRGTVAASLNAARAKLRDGLEEEG